MTTRSPSPLKPAALAALGVGVLGLLGSAWRFSDALVRAKPVRRIVKAARVLAHGEGQVKLTRTAESVRPGVLGLTWPEGHALLGPASEVTRKTVTRPLLKLEGTLPVGARVRPTSLAYGGTPATLGLAFQDVTVPAPMGEMPAWLVPGERQDTWVILVHGYNGLREDALRVLPLFRRLGLPSLTITFRNAHGAPRTPDGYYRLGAAEWEDLEAAVQYAQAHGARRVLLFGFSMGGNIVLSFLRRSPLASLVAGVILDSPALEWRALLRHHARRLHIPWAAGPLERATVFRSKQDFAAVDHLSATDTFATPMLVFHGTADITVPVEQSDALSQARPDLVEYVRAEGAEHIRVWNVDPAGYEGAVAGFVGRVLPGEKA
ncbi:alpha/beta hydrolase [Deinococcus aluminii]|uniref:Serine aminopeptidase S33 domain-containing protein n=1 Tax=Deinococcus aluminii TaxID=1656885 RepID=A0ABP9XEG2_9DEIO